MTALYRGTGLLRPPYWGDPYLHSDAPTPSLPLDENLLVVLRLLKRDSVGLVLAEEAGRLEVLNRLFGVELQKRLPEGQYAHACTTFILNITSFAFRQRAAQNAFR